MDPREESMPVALTIKNVPDDLADRLRERAADHRRSLQRELLLMLEQIAALGSAEAIPGEDRATKRVRDPTRRDIPPRDCGSFSEPPMASPCGWRARSITRPL